jgi:hypothetical protein
MGLNKSINLEQIKKYTVNDFKAFAYGDYTVTSASTGIASILPTDQPRMMHVYVESDTASPSIAIRYRIDGGAPVATGAGIPRVNGDEFFIYEFANIQKFRVIEEVANTTNLRITFYK